jgi:hypothetical protein
LHPGFPVGPTHYILGFPEGVFSFSLHLLGNALDLKRRIAGQLARFSFDASDDFVGRTVHSIAIHWATSVGSTHVASTKAPKCISGASFKGHVASCLLKGDTGSSSGRGFDAASTVSVSSAVRKLA